jgi:hypothetical protein
LSGATIGGFNITENYLNLGTQINWNPNSATEGLIMGLDTADSKYKFFVGNNTDHLIWNGSNLIISGFALIGDSSSTTTLNDLAQWNDIFEIVNPGQVNEYLKVKAPLASTGEIAAWSGDSEDFPPSIWDSMRIASSTYVGGVKLSSDFNIATDGTLSINGDIGSGFDETSNYSPSGIWNFTGTLNYGGNAVATQTWANGQFHPLGGSSTNNFETNDLVIHGTVNHWVGDVITVDDARLQLNRTQDAATVASGIDIYNGTSVVSSLLYSTSGRWQIGGQNIATESWVGNGYLPLSGGVLSEGLTVGSSSNYPQIVFGGDNRILFRAGDLLRYRYNGTDDGIIWHSGNDGSGSGLDADKLDNLDSSQFLRSDTNDVVNGQLDFNAKVRSASRYGMFGNYDSNYVQGIWSIDTGYSISKTNNDFGSQFGITYAHTNAGTSGLKKPITGWGHQILFTSNGERNISLSLSGNAYFSGNVGISTTSPTEALDVNGNILASGEVTAYSHVNTRDRFRIYNSSGALKWSIGNDDTTDDLVFYNASGVKQASLSQTGDLTAVGEVTAYGT